MCIALHMLIIKHVLVKVFQHTQHVIIEQKYISMSFGDLAATGTKEDLPNRFIFC